MTTVPDPDQNFWTLDQDPVTHEWIVVPTGDYPAAVAGELPLNVRRAFDRNQDPEFNRAAAAGMAR